MALQFHPLPLDVFQDEARPFIGRFNHELRQLFGLESVLRNPIASQRSDLSIVRRDDVQVDVSRITPSISPVVSGVSTAVGTPQLTFGTVNTVGSTTTALSINSAIALFGTQLPSALAAAAAVGSSAYAARADHVHKFSPTLLSTANDSSMTLTDDATDQTLTFGLGLLNIVPGSGININFPNSSVTPSFIFKPNTTTAAETVVSVQMRPAAGTRTGMSPNVFSPTSGVTFSAQTFRCWDSQMISFAGQYTGCTFVGYDITTMTMAPSSGSSSGNCLYGIRNQTFQINNANASWAEVATALFKGIRRSITSPKIDTQATLIIEPPTGASTTQAGAASPQIGLLIRQQTAQVTSAERFAIKVDAQNSGTLRYAFYGASDTLFHGGNVQHTGQRVGLYGATPTVQFGTTGTEAGFAAGTSTAVTVDSTFTGNTGSLAYTFGDCISALKRIGALAY